MGLSVSVEIYFSPLFSFLLIFTSLLQPFPLFLFYTGEGAKQI